MNRTSNYRRIGVAIFIAGMIPTCDSAIVQFTIDSSQTQVTLSGTAAGLAVDEQGPGSLTTSFEGMILADLTADSLRFVGGSQIDGVTNGDWSPKAMGVAGTEPADFGAAASGGLISGTAALRNLLLDLESESVALAEGAFNADGLRFRFPDEAPSAFDYRVTVFISTQSDRELLAGYATNHVAGTGTLTEQDNVQILEVPIEATIVFELLSPADSTLTISGQLHATRSLEPDTEIVLGSVRLTDGSFTFEWNDAAGDAAHIESSVDLVDWARIADIPPGVRSWSVDETTSGSGYFRVVK